MSATAAARTLARSKSFSGKRRIDTVPQGPGTGRTRQGVPKLQDHPDVALDLVAQGLLSKERAAALEARMHEGEEEEDPAFAAVVEYEEQAKAIQADIEQVHADLEEIDAAATASSEPSPKRAKTAEKGEYRYETIYTRAYVLNKGCLTEAFIPKKTRVYGELVLGRCMGIAHVVTPPEPKKDDDLM